jgi:glycosyltransferase involved in cell wall biosynthesis
MTRRPPHIVVCICTFKRPELLQSLLEALERQGTDALFTFSVVVIDNDRDRSAESVCLSFSQTSSVAIQYSVEPQQNIALARNRAIANAVGDFVALIDDDELPCEGWLLQLFQACHRFEADGVLGPVLPSYGDNPPRWVVKGGFYERPVHETGMVLEWSQTRTGNALLKKTVFTGIGEPFRSAFGMGGEDRDFFRRAIERGFRFVWSADACVYETVPAIRCTRSFMIRRALLRGTIPHFSHADFVKSLVAIPLYTLSLPVAACLGHHRFMKYLIKDCDHIGRVLAFCGITVIRQKYVVE